MASTDALVLRVMALMAETKDLGKAVVAALKAKGKGKKAAKVPSDASSADSASTPSKTRQATSWQDWGKFVLGDEAAYGEFKASYAHPTNGSKQGVSIAYQQHRAYLNHTSADGGLTEEYAAFIAPYLEAKAAKAAAAAAAKAATPKKAKAAAAAAPVAPLKPARGGAGGPPSEDEEEAVFSSSSSLVLFSEPPLPPAPTPGSLPRLPSLTPETAAPTSAPAAEAAAPKVVKKVVSKKAAAVVKVVKTVKAKTVVEPSSPEPWTWNGRALLKNIRNEVWATDGEGERVWVGVYDPEADTMDEMVDEPTA